VIRVYLAGEGRSELGRFCDRPPYFDPNGAEGVLEALMKTLEAREWQVVAGTTWRHVPIFRVGGIHDAEAHRVCGHVQRALENNCSVLIFSRDRDGHGSMDDRIDAALSLCEHRFPALKVAGGLAKQKIEAWILLILGDRRAEEYADPASRLADRHQTVEGMAAVARECKPDLLPPSSLRSWLEKVLAALQ
jgi:hypothetical protein